MRTSRGPRTRVNDRNAEESRRVSVWKTTRLPPNKKRYQAPNRWYCCAWSRVVGCSSVRTLRHDLRQPRNKTPSKVIASLGFFENSAYPLINRVSNEGLPCKQLWDPAQPEHPLKKDTNCRYYCTAAQRKTTICAPRGYFLK